MLTVQECDHFADFLLPALRMLEREGFLWRGYIDPFDAGPTVEARREAIGSWEPAPMADSTDQQDQMKDRLHALEMKAAVEEERAAEGEKGGC